MVSLGHKGLNIHQTLNSLKMPHMGEHSYGYGFYHCWHFLENTDCILIRMHCIHMHTDTHIYKCASMYLLSNIYEQFWKLLQGHSPDSLSIGGIKSMPWNWIYKRKIYHCHYSDMAWALGHLKSFDCLFNSMFSVSIKKISKFRITGRLWGDSTSDRFPASWVSNVESISYHYVLKLGQNVTNATSISRFPALCWSRC